MPYEKFTKPKKVSKAAPKPPQVKILKGGQVSLNAVAYEQHLKGAKYVELFYDPDTGKIGLKPKKYATKATFPIRAVGKSKATYRVKIKMLSEHHGIDIGEKKSVEPVWNESDELLEIEV